MHTWKHRVGVCVESKGQALRAALGLVLALHCQSAQALLVASGPTKQPMAHSVWPRRPKVVTGRPSVGGRRATTASGRRQRTQPKESSLREVQLVLQRRWEYRGLIRPSRVGLHSRHSVGEVGAHRKTLMARSGFAGLHSNEGGSSVPRGRRMQFSVRPPANPLVNRTCLRQAGYQQR
jgi:hypothetical protein